MRQLLSRGQRLRWLCLLLAFLPQQLLGASATLDQLKVAYLFNIAKFVSWPDSSNEVTLCASPSSQHRSLLQSLHERPLDDNRRLLLRFTNRLDEDCQLFYLDQPRTAKLATKALVAENPASQTLVVADVGMEPDANAAICFFIAQNKLRFSIDKQLLSSASYQVSSKLLRLARTQ